MGTQPSSREDTFGTEGIGEGDDSDIGKTGHSSQGGTANARTGGTQGNQPRPNGSAANKQGVGEAPLDVNEPAKR